MAAIKRLVDDKKWELTYIRDLMRYVASRRGDEGFRFGLVKDITVNI